MAFRHMVRPGLLPAWWQQDVANHLMQFYRDMKAGRRPALVLQAPPQHGKTEQVHDFVAWCAGQNPNTKIIFASYSEDLGIKVNMALQRMFNSPLYKAAFAKTAIGEENVVTSNRAMVAQ